MQELLMRDIKIHYYYIRLLLLQVFGMPIAACSMQMPKSNAFKRFGQLQTWSWQLFGAEMWSREGLWNQ